MSLRQNVGTTESMKEIFKKKVEQEKEKKQMDQKSKENSSQVSSLSKKVVAFILSHGIKQRFMTKEIENAKL